MADLINVIDAPAWIRSHNCLANHQRPSGAHRRLTHKLQYFISFHSARIFFLYLMDSSFFRLFDVSHVLKLQIPPACAWYDRTRCSSSYIYFVLGLIFFLSLGMIFISRKARMVKGVINFVSSYELLSHKLTVTL